MLKKVLSLLMAGTLLMGMSVPALAVALTPDSQTVPDALDPEKVFQSFDFSIPSGNYVAGTEPITLQYYNATDEVVQDTYLRIAPGTEFSLRYDGCEEYSFIGFNSLRLYVNVYDSSKNYEWDVIDHDLKDDGGFISYYSPGGYSGQEKRHLSVGESVTFKLPEAEYGDRSLYRVFLVIDHPNGGAGSYIYSAMYHFVVDSNLGSGSNVPKTPPATEPASNVAYATGYQISVNGSPVSFDAYALKDENGNDTNYLKLRDVAHILNGTSAQFEVGWDGSIVIDTGKPYTNNGSEMSTPFSGNQNYQISSNPVVINGQPAALDAILLTDNSGSGYTYFKLRDLGDALGFTVNWSAEAGITITTD